MGSTDDALLRQEPPDSASAELSLHPLWLALKGEPLVYRSTLPFCGAGVSPAGARASCPLWSGHSARELWYGHLGRESARARCPCHGGRDARTTSHAATPSAAGPLFSRTFSLCSGDFGVWAAFSSTGLSVLASSPTTLLSSSAARSSASRAGAVREPPLRRPAHGHASAGSYTLNSEGRLSVRRSHSREEITTIDDAGG